MPIRRSPNGARHIPSTGWSRSPGMGGRDQSERTGRNQSEQLVAITRCAQTNLGASPLRHKRFHETMAGPRNPQCDLGLLTRRAKLNSNL